MKHIVKKTDYWFLKKTDDRYDYYFVRSMTDGIDKPNWFIGYENSFGLVSSVGGPLTEDKQKELESEFQLELKK